MGEISKRLYAWKCRRKPFKVLAMGIDANVQLPAHVEGCTGGWVHRQTQELSGLKRTAAEII
eukprot:6945893-Lingulodinium_polyedra.AAC.1